MYSAGGRENFEQLVTEALAALPKDLAARMSNVDIVVEDRPKKALARTMEVDPDRLLGLYQGVPLTERGEAYFGVLPDKICLYQDNIERAAYSRNDLKEIVRRTVIHEVAHHFGISDERLEELGWA